MAMGQEESDDVVVPEGRRKAVPTAPLVWGGKDVTASEEVRQLELFRETADSPKGADVDRGAGGPAMLPRSVPKSRTMQGAVSPAMTMSEVAEEVNLRRAFQKVASNKGAPGPDRQSIAEVREHLDETLKLGKLRAQADVG